jgi:transposase
MGFITGFDRNQDNLLPPRIDDYISSDAMVRIVDEFVDSIDLIRIGFGRAIAARTGRPGYHPADMIKLYIWGYLNQIRSSRQLERACLRDLEAIWLLRRLTPDYRTIAAFRHDNPDAIVGVSAAFIDFCKDYGLVRGNTVSLDGTKMKAVASAKNIAGKDRLERDIAHTEKEIAYYLDRLDIADQQSHLANVDNQSQREAFAGAVDALKRRRERLQKRRAELQNHEAKVVVFGEPEAKPMGYGRSQKHPSYNLQSAVDIDSGLIVHHEVSNEANDSNLLHPVAMNIKQVLKVDKLNVLADGGYSNAQAIAQCERDQIEVAAPIKRGAMNTDFFRPVQFVYNEETDTIQCPAGKTMKPSGKHTRNRAIRYRTKACTDCNMKSKCTAGVQRTIHRLIDQSALDRMEARINENPNLMTIRRCTVEHPFGTIKRMSGGGRFLMRGMKKIRAEAALSVLSYNIIRASNLVGRQKLAAAF